MVRDMSEWFTSRYALDVLAGRQRGDSDGLAANTQQLLGQQYVPGGPDEEWTDDPPPLFTGGLSEDQDNSLPVCELMGEYLPDKRLIRIYNKGIQHTATHLERQGDLGRYGLREDLEQITRHHEHAHALVHLGSFPGDGALPRLAHEDSTFVAERRLAFDRIEGNIHEALAQAMTWRCIRGRTPEKRRLQLVFRTLMAHQPAAYRLPPASLRATSTHLPRLHPPR